MLYPARAEGLVNSIIWHLKSFFKGMSMCLRYFCNRQTYLGYCPVPGPTLKGPYGFSEAHDKYIEAAWYRLAGRIVFISTLRLCVCLWFVGQSRLSRVLGKPRIRITRSRLTYTSSLSGLYPLALTFFRGARFIP